MITNLSDYRRFNESLSGDLQRAAKLATLVQLGKDMLENYKKAEEFTALKAEKNTEVKELLERLNKTSVIAEGVLIEVYKPYMTTRLASKEYFDFVNNSVGVINEDFKTLSEAIKSISTKLTGGTSYIRTTKNTRNLPEGTLKTTESLSTIWNSIRDWFKSFKESLLSMLPDIDAKLEDIKKNAAIFNTTTTESVVSEALTPEQILARNAYSKEYKRNRREQNKNIADILVKAKEAIDHSKKEAYYKELAATNEKMIIQLLNELNAKSVAIDDKILTLVNVAEKESLDMKKYEEKITNANEVGDAVAKMAKALLEIHKNTSSVSGSIRHIGDTSNSQDGTFNAHFDHETNTVIPATVEGKTNEGLSSWMIGMWKSIKGFFTSFRTASKDADTALANI